MLRAFLQTLTVLGFSFALFLGACGKEEGGFRKVTLVTNLGGQGKSFHNLSDELVHQDFLPKIFTGGTCKQKYLFTAVKTGATPDQLMPRFPIKLRMSTVSNFTVTDESLMLAQLNLGSTFLEEPITAIIPRGQQTKVGILGSIYEPHDVSPGGGDDFCDNDLLPGNTPAPSYSLIGHITIPANSNASTVMLNTWVVKSQHPAVITSGNLHCSAVGPDNQNCPRHDFLKITMPTAALTPLSLITVESLANENAPARYDYRTLANSGGGAQGIYHSQINVVSILPIKVTYTLNGAGSPTSIVLSNMQGPGPVDIGPFRFEKF